MTDLPAEFATYTRGLMGEALYQTFLRGMSEEAPTSIRLNPFKCQAANASLSIPSQPVWWCPATGRYLEGRPAFTFDPLFHAGMYYVQEASSMFLDHVVRHLVHHPIMALDLCAAPGGKATTLRAALPKGSLLFCNEPIHTRAHILSENIQKFGHPDVIVTNNYPKDYKRSKWKFDLIACDAPCSGEGMFRKDEGAIKEWNRQNIDNCSRLQKEIISDIWDCLKPGGWLIYSTCTFNAHEDEENAAWIAQELKASFISIPIEKDWNITPSLIDSNPTYRFIPGKSRGEGLFLAAFQKQGELTPTIFDTVAPRKKNRTKNKNASQESLSSHWLKDDTYMASTCIGDSTYAIPAWWMPYMAKAKETLRILHAGIKIGYEKGKDLIPSQSLALSILLNREAFHAVELNYENAIRFLRKEAVTLPYGTPKGHILVCYRGIPLGFEKNIGNRANNLYPAEWKIKSTHTPKGTKEILTW